MLSLSHVTATLCSALLGCSQTHRRAGLPWVVPKDQTTDRPNRPKCRKTKQTRDHCSNTGRPVSARKINNSWKTPFLVNRSSAANACCFASRGGQTLLYSRRAQSGVFSPTFPPPPNDDDPRESGGGAAGHQHTKNRRTTTSRGTPTGTLNERGRERESAQKLR